MRLEPIQKDPLSLAARTAALFVFMLCVDIYYIATIILHLLVDPLLKEVLQSLSETCLCGIGMLRKGAMALCS